MLFLFLEVSVLGFPLLIIPALFTWGPKTLFRDLFTFVYFQSSIDLKYNNG